MLPYILTKILARRLENNFTQNYMASQLKISQGYYNKIENGKNEMSAKTMFEIMKILDMDVAGLFSSFQKEESA
jgi:transcriptional regulator with XRE-family HTH domain